MNISKENIKVNTKKFWNFLDGKKTKIGTILHIAGIVASVMLDDYINETHQIVYHSVVGHVTTVGVFDKVRKFINSDSGKKIISLINKLITKK